MEFKKGVARRTRSRTEHVGWKSTKNRNFTANSSKSKAKKRKGTTFAKKNGKRPAFFRENSSTASENADGGNMFLISDSSDSEIKEVSSGSGGFSSETESEDRAGDVAEGSPEPEVEAVAEQSSEAEPEEEAETEESSDVESVEECSTESVSEEEEETDSDEVMEGEEGKAEASETDSSEEGNTESEEELEVEVEGSKASVSEIIELSSGDEHPRKPVRSYHYGVANRTRSKTSYVPGSSRGVAAKPSKSRKKPKVVRAEPIKLKRKLKEVRAEPSKKLKEMAAESNRKAKEAVAGSSKKQKEGMAEPSKKQKEEVMAEPSKKQKVVMAEPSKKQKEVMAEPNKKQKEVMAEPSKKHKEIMAEPRKSIKQKMREKMEEKIKEKKDKSTKRKRRSKVSSSTRCLDGDEILGEEAVGDNVEELCEEVKEIRKGKEKLKTAVKTNRRFYEFLTNSMWEEEDELENLMKPEPQEEVRPVLPRKFNWKTVQEKPAKTKEEEQLAPLWAELELGLRIGEIGSSAVEDDEEAVEDGYCPKGKHNMVLNEEIGLICSICSYVETEIRYVLPSMDKGPGPGQSKSYFREDNRDSLHDLEMDGSEEDLDLGEQCPRTGTVWDLVPRNISSKLFPHQKEGFEFMWNNLGGSTDLEELRSLDQPRHVGGCIMSHAPGTGKTRLTLVFLKSYLELFPRSRPIVIAPTTMLLTWEEEFKKGKINVPFHNLNNNEFSMEERHEILKLVDENRHLKKNKEMTRMVKLHSWGKSKSVLGISYDLFKQLLKKDDTKRKILLEMPGVVVLDEGHTPRNDESGIWNILLMLKTKKRIILSGTPFQNNCEELSNTLEIVRPEVAKRMASKLNNLSNKSSSKVDDQKPAILKAAMAPFVNVYKGSILQKDLPGLSNRVLVLNPTEYQAKILQSIGGGCDATSVSTFDFEHKQALATVHPSLVLCSKLSEKEKVAIMPEQERLKSCRSDPKEGAKTRFLVEFIGLVAGKEKVLVFSQYRRPLNLIMEQLSSAFSWTQGVEILTMTGNLEQKHRQNMIGQFNDPGSRAKVMLASIRACSEGISLVGASRVILLDVVWNPSVERQAISRAYRLGQKKVVYTYHLMVKGSKERDRYIKQGKKQKLSDFFFSSTNEEEEVEEEEIDDATPAFEDQLLDAMTSHPELKGLFDPAEIEPRENNMIEKKIDLMVVD